MDFSYHDYLAQLKYQPYKWPPDIALAELHSRCSAPGPPNPRGVKCPCCGFAIKKKKKGWLYQDVYQDFKQYGAGIPAYFGLLRFYNVIMILIFLINTVYPWYATSYTCNNFNIQVSPICVSVGPFNYLAFWIMDQTLTNNQQTQMVENLQILQTIVFYILLISNNLSIFYLIYIEKRCKKSEQSSQRFLSLLVENLENGISQEKLINLLTIDGIRPKIKKITFLKQVKKFQKLFNERIKAYYQLKALQIEEIKPKTEIELNQNFLKLNAQYKSLKGLDHLQETKAIIVFEDREEQQRIHKYLEISESFTWYIGLKNLLLPSDKKIEGLETFTSEMPALEEIIWVNIGQNHLTRMVAKVKTLITFVILTILCYALLYYPMKAVLYTKSKTVQGASLTLFEKIFPTIMALVMLTLSFSFRYYMEVLAQRRNPNTHLKKSGFILITTVMFHLLFYILIPTIFFVFKNDIYPSVKLYTISEQARAFLTVQLILSFIDLGYRIWSANKREAFKFPQKLLHERVQYKEFPLQMKLMVMFKMWSFVLLYSFFLPAISFLILIVMLILYLLEKRNLYVHYTQRRYIGIDLEIGFLTKYIYIFCLFVCFIYSVNCVTIKAWNYLYAALAFTVVSLIVQLVYGGILRSRFKDHENKKLNAIKGNKLVVDLLAQFFREQKTYDEAYKTFLDQFNHPEIDAEIDSYIQFISRRQSQQQQLNLITVNSRKSELLISQNKRQIAINSDNNQPQ